MVEEVLERICILDVVLNFIRLSREGHWMKDSPTVEPNHGKESADPGIGIPANGPSLG